MITYQAAIV